MEKRVKEFSLSEVRINCRSSIDISGVEDVISYDDRSIVLVVCGVRTVVEGEELHVTRLSVEEGKVSATGHIGALIYEEAPVKKGGFLSGLFRG